MTTMSFTDDSAREKGGTRGGTPRRAWQVGDQAVLNHRAMKALGDAEAAEWALSRGRNPAAVLGVRANGYVVLLWNTVDHEVSIVDPAWIHAVMQDGGTLHIFDDERDGE